MLIPPLDDINNEVGNQGSNIRLKALPPVMVLVEKRHTGICLDPDPSGMLHGPIDGNPSNLQQA
jgi:hypothetical protein